jgi:hypothetical protein
MQGKKDFLWGQLRQKSCCSLVPLGKLQETDFLRFLHADKKSLE